MKNRGRTRRSSILEFIREYEALNGYAPSVGEIAQSLGTVKSNVFHHLIEMEREGTLRHTPGRARSWQVV